MANILSGEPQKPFNPLDPQRGDHMNPYGRSRGGRAMMWVIGGMLLAVAVLATYLII